MKPGTYLSLLYRPDTARELAARQPELSAVVINAMYGILGLVAISSQLLEKFTSSLVLLTAILFGPLIGFIVSSLYTRVEMTVGRRLGGTATLAELYRSFAWSLIPAGLAVLLYTILSAVTDKTSAMRDIIVSIPVFVLIGCGIRNYCSNIIAAQRFSLARGLAEIILACILSLVLLAGGVGLVTFLFRCGTGESLSSLFSQS